ncbi:MAG TPA: four helix bundle protein [Polyangiales bacterium]|nr:four helix bundle protein [Polyangiales bacterium]
MWIYEMCLEMIASVCRLADLVQRRDKDLARQMRKACTSVPLNFQEGQYSRGGNQIARWQDAMGSAKETMACLQVCVAARYLTQTQVDADLDRIDQIVAGLYRRCHPRRA